MKVNETIITIDYDQIAKVAKTIRKVKIPIDDFSNPKYYPPKNDDPENVLRYFIFMVALDHRVSRPGKPYEGIVDGEFYHGADLLYRLGAKKYLEDPKWFSPEHMASIRLDEFRSWLTVNNPKRSEPPDIEVRVMLLRDLGYKLVKLYSSSVSLLIESAKGYLKGLHGGLIDRLKVFRAYEDPVEKKPYLFVKFITRRGLFNPIDKYNLELPIDNHLTRIALRLGIVRVNGLLKEKIINHIEVSWEEDVLLRIAVRKAYKKLAELAGIDPTILDDFLWMFGRKCCTREKPVCNTCTSSCKKYGWCNSSGCVLRNACLAGQGLLEKYFEHTYLNTWYY